MNALRSGTATLAVLLLAACTAGPRYNKPDTEQPTAYKEASAQNQVWSLAQPSEPRLNGNWWTVFDDPELDRLESQLALSNQSLKVAEAHYHQALAMVGYARAAELPSVTIAPEIDSLHRSRAEPYPYPRTYTTGNFVLPLELSYEVDLWGKVRREVAASREEAQASAADLATATLSLQAELAMDYFHLRAADAQQHLLNETVRAYSDALRLTQNRFEGGAAPESDVAQARTQLNAARVADTDIAVERAQYEHAIAVLVGVPPATFSLAPAPLDRFQLPTIPVGVPSTLLQRRPDIAAAERRMAEANDQIGIARAAYYPSVTLGGAGGLQGHSLTDWLDWPNLFWAVGMSMSQTLFDGGRRHATNTAAEANYDATVATYRQTTLTAFQEVEDNLAALNILLREAEQEKEAVDSAQRSLQLSTNRYIGGADTYLQVISAQTIALENQRNDVDIRQRQLVVSVLLIKALGGGWDTARVDEVARR